MTTENLFLLSPLLGLVLLMKALSRTTIRQQQNPELMRKILHIGMGMVALALPLLLDTPEKIIVASSLAFTWLLCVRLAPELRRIFGKALFGIARSSWGELYFAVAVVSLLFISNGSWLLYTIPILILTLADSLAAIAGLYIKSPELPTPERKTVAGSVTFFTVATLCSFLSLQYFTAQNFVHLFILSGLIGAVATIAEAISSKGSDNFFVPLSAFVVLYLSETVGWL